MNKLQLLGGGAVVTSTIMVATAGAFAASPSTMQGLAYGSPNSAAAAAHHKIMSANGNHPFVKVRDAIAQTLGLTPDQLKTELQTKTLDQLATEHGMTRQQLLTSALKNTGFSDAQIQKIMNAMVKVPHHKVELPKLQ
jgi:hypothetical protein